MINPKVADLMTEQIKNEIYSAHLYLSMASFFEDAAYPGMAQWMRVQWLEETRHAMRFLNYLNDAGIAAPILAIDAPPDPSTFKSPLDCFQMQYDHERKVTALCHNIYQTAVEVKDHASAEVMRWFVEEQIEEEKHALDLLTQFKRIGNNQSAILVMDEDLGDREPGSPPPGVTVP